MPDFHLALTLKAGLIVVAIPAAILVAWWSYRYTVPPISKRLKSVLVSLRSSALTFIFLLLGEPLLSLFTHSVEQPVTALLIDNSRSMSIKDPRGDRKEILTHVLESSALSKLHSTGATKYVVFDLSSKNLSSYSPDSITLNGDGTDIGNAIKGLTEPARIENIQAVVLLSDGEFTVGSSPVYEAEELGLPIFTVGIGDSSEQKDVQIRKVIANEITYVGNSVPVNVTVKSAGFSGERVEVTLRDGGTVLDRKVLTLEPGTREYPISMSFTPSKEGFQKFTAEVSKLTGELTDRNNTMSFFTKVLKSKMQVVLIAGAPSQDVAFIRRALAGDNNVDLRPFIEQKNGSFYGGNLSSQVINDADCLVLIDFPNATTLPATFGLVRDAMSGSKPFLIVLGRTMDFQRLRSMETALPFVIGDVSPNEYQIFIAIPESKRNNSVLKLSTGSFDAWSKLSPVFRTQTIVRAKPESEVLGTARIQSVISPDPVLVSRNVSRRKSFAVLAYGLWRWKMFAESGSGTENLLDEFLSNAVRWLTTREDDRRFRAEPVKSIFSGQDPIEFTGQVYDENYKPVDDAMVRVGIAHGKQTTEIVMNPVGNGQYAGSLDRLDEGDYTFTAKAEQAGKVVADDKGTFSVGGLNIEFLDTRMNKLLLQQIAARSGGKYYDSDELESLPTDISSLPNFKPRELTRTHEVDLWNSRWMLGAIVLILALEWFLRKRSGMI